MRSLVTWSAASLLLGLTACGTSQSGAGPADAESLDGQALDGQEMDSTGPILSADASSDAGTGAESSTSTSDGAPDAPAFDAAVDGPAEDAPADAPSDGTIDASADAPFDAPADAPVDSPAIPGCEGSVACGSASACPTPSTACVVATCTSSCCDTAPAPLGTTCTDNGGTVCDGNGNCVSCNTPTDCPKQPTACVLDTCTGHVCGTNFAAAGSACTDNSGTHCTAAGACVSQCMDGVQDGNETGTDCGGGTCPACGVGDECLVDADCVSSACDPVTGKCTSSQCNDQVRDGNETDVDCGGGICPTCPLTSGCNVDGDCASDACSVCSPTRTCIANQCADCQKDGTETDVDCGGGTCSACGVGKSCLTNFDCQSGHVCNASEICQ